jgi:hypothetical protein
MKPFILNNFKPNERIETEDFVIRKLEAKDVALDLAAVQSSIDIIKKVRGGTWPDSNIELEENRIDLSWHQREFEVGTSFAYSCYRHC